MLIRVGCTTVPLYLLLYCTQHTITVCGLSLNPAAVRNLIVLDEVQPTFRPRSGERPDKCETFITTLDILALCWDIFVHWRVMCDPRIPSRTPFRLEIHGGCWLCSHVQTRQTRGCPLKRPTRWWCSHYSLQTAASLPRDIRRAYRTHTVKMIESK